MLLHINIMWVASQDYINTRLRPTEAPHTHVYRKIIIPARLKREVNRSQRCLPLPNYRLEGPYITALRGFLQRLRAHTLHKSEPRSVTSSTRSASQSERSFQARAPRRIGSLQLVRWGVSS
jgi:hypothetical protein